MIPGVMAISDAPLSALPELMVFFIDSDSITAESSEDFRILAATREFITRDSDALRNRPFLGTLINSLRVDRSIVGGLGFSSLSISWGEIELINAEADYDSVISDYAIDGRRVRLTVGAYNAETKSVDAYDDFYVLFDGTASGWHADEGVLRVELRDNSSKLDVPAQATKYSGSGDLEGGTELSGKNKPVAYGQLSNITPVMVIASELVLQVNDGRIEAVTAVYDTGASLTFDADYSTSTLLRAATLVAGEYATCLTEGLIRLGGSAFGAVTADVKGDKTGGTYVNTVGTIIRRLVTTAGELIDPDDLVDYRFDDMESDQAAIVGYYLDQNSTETCADVVGNLMGSVGGWGGFTRLGQFEIRLFTAPTSVASQRYEKQDILEISRERLPDSIDPPPHRFRMAYDRNWTVQTDVVASVSEGDPDRAAYLTQGFRLVATDDDTSAAILIDHPLAQDPEPVSAYFVSSSDAQDEADRLIALYGTQRSLYRVKVSRAQFIHDIGDVIHVTYPRWDLSSGRYLRIVSIVDDSNNDTADLVAFG